MTDRVAVASFVAKHIKNTAKGEVDEQQLANAISEIEIETELEGSSFIKVHLIDPYWELATSDFLARDENGLLDKIQCEFPENSGYWWQLAAVELGNDTTQPNVVLVMEDRIVAWLRERSGEKFAPVGTTTRAQFVKALLDEVGLKDRTKKIDAVIPSLNVLQPVESKNPGQQEVLTNREATGQENSGGILTARASATEHKRINKTPGLGTGAVTIKGAKPTSAQVALINEALGVASSLKAGQREMEALFEACITENDFTNNGAGLLQFEPATASGLGINPLDVKQQVTAFLTKSYSKGTLETGPGGAIEYAQKHPSAPAYEIAQAAQGSGAGEASKGAANYGVNAAEAKAIIAGGGGTTGESGGESDIGQLARGTSQSPDENSFECIERLAKQVRWFAFTDGRRFFYMDGADFVRQTPTAYLDLPGRTIKHGHTGKVGTDVVLAGLLSNFDNCLALDTPLPTPDGWATMGDLQLGNIIFGADGKPTVVKRASRVYVGRECFRVTFNDGTSIVADASHLWETITRRRDDGTLREITHQRYLGVRSTETIAQTLRVPSEDRGLNHHVRVAGPLELPELDLPVDPYVLGYWLGDGRSADPMISVGGEDLPSLESALTEAGYHFRVTRDKGSGFESRGLNWLVYASTLPLKRGNTDSLKQRLRGLRVLGDKHVPDMYLRASLAQRLELLRGLMDSGGSASGRGCCFSATNRRLAVGVRELTHSLGFRSQWCEKSPRGHGRKPQYHVTFSARPHLTPFRLPRKARRYDKQRAVKTNGGSAGTRTIIAVEPVPSVPVRCIEVDALDQLYLAGESMVPTHNTSYEYYATHKRRGKAIRKAKVAKPQTPSEVHFPLLCEPTEYRAGDVFVIQNSGPLNGRWVVTNAVRKYIEDPFTTLTLEPPEEPYPEPLASSTTAGHTESSFGAIKSVVEAAKKALSEKSKYAYVYGAGHDTAATLFGASPREMDCSAFAELCYKAAKQPDPAGGQYTAGTQVMIENMVQTNQPQPGDLCFFGTLQHTTHVTVYVGNGRAISMGQQGDPDEGPAETTGPSGFLGYWRPK